MGYCFIHSFGNARNQENRVRQYVPTPYFYLKADQGNREAIGDKRMLVLAIVLYVIGTILRHWWWPIEALGGEGGCLNQILAVAWFVLLLAGLGVFD